MGEGVIPIRCSVGYGVIRSAVQGAAGALFADAAALPVVGAPLFEEEWGAAF